MSTPPQPSVLPSSVLPSQSAEPCSEAGSIPLSRSATAPTSSWSPTRLLKSLSWPSKSSSSQSAELAAGTRRLHFSRKIIDLIREAERTHRAAHPVITLSVTRYADQTQDDYKATDEFTVQADENGVGTDVRVRTDYRFGTWTAGKGPSDLKSKDGRAATFSFVPKHRLADLLEGEQVLQSKAIAIGSSSVEFLIEAKNIIDEAMKAGNEAIEGEEFETKYGSMPTITLSITVQRGGDEE